jgi:beta-lactamase regulating signal transducer with metallopeptidase domain
MTAPMTAELALLPGGAAAVLADAALKGVLLLALAALAARLLRGAPAAARHLAWALAFAGLLALPALAALLPAWQVPVLPPGWVEVRVRTDAPTANPSVERTASAEAASRETSLAAAPPAGRPSRGALALFDSESSRKPFSWPAVALLVWATGALALLARLGAGVARVRALERRARPVTDPLTLRTARSAAARLGVTRPVALLEGSGPEMPMTWGCFRPRVLLPAGAGEWPAARLEAVLVHELAHVRRWDCLTQMAAEAACALHWFNPLAWAAGRRLRLESEHACDDHVLRDGSRPADYAEDLLHVARSLARPRPAALAAVAMARPTQLRTRLLAVLNERRPRGPVPPRALPAAFLAAGVGVVLLAVVTPTFALRAVPRPDPFAFTFGAPCPDDGRPKRTSHTDLTDDHRWETRWSVDGCGGVASIVGRVELDAAGTDVVSIERGGSLVLELRGAEGRQRAVIRPAPGGGLERRFWVEGRERAWDDTARAWLARALPELLRRTSYDDAKKGDAGAAARLDEAKGKDAEAKPATAAEPKKPGEDSGPVEDAGPVSADTPETDSDVAAASAQPAAAAQDDTLFGELMRPIVARYGGPNFELFGRDSGHGPTGHRTIRVKDAEVSVARGITHVGPGGYVVVTDVRAGVRRSVVVLAGAGGRPDYRFSGDFDGDPMEWLHERIADFLGRRGEIRV